MRWTFAAALPLVLVACGQGDSDNVMMPNANALPPALVDLALGPETANVSTNAAEPVETVTPAESTESESLAIAPRTSNRVDAAPTEEPADATAEEEAAAETDSVEE